ncbi:hypothetical protein WME97_11780 [Sorangium sp. So ce367]|uniref:hypothetical protein n=1 Tax=Sorangium sp. So ce367 TaxID=3133305 RepID=UPI003F5FD23C
MPSPAHGLDPFGHGPDDPPLTLVCDTIERDLLGSPPLRLVMASKAGATRTERGAATAAPFSPLPEKGGGRRSASPLAGRTRSRRSPAAV